MLSTPHVITGIAIAANVAPLWASVPLSFASHFVLDMIPHWNPHLNTEMRTYGKITQRTKNIIYVDTAVAFGIIGFAMLRAGVTTPYAFAIGLNGIASITPDLMEAPYFFFHMRHKALLVWLKFQKSIQSDAELIPGLLTQVVVIAVSLWWMLSAL